MLIPRDPLSADDNRRMTLRVVCSERPPGEWNLSICHMKLFYFCREMSIQTSFYAQDIDVASIEPIQASQTFIYITIII